MEYKSVALFCGSASGSQPEYAEMAREFGKRLAQKQITLYYGGGCIGLMGEAAKGAMENGGKVIGVSPEFFKKGEVLAEDITELIIVDNMSERKQLMERESDAFVILPGGYGTMDELFEVITDAQLGLHFKPVVIFNINGYYDALVALLERFCEDGFLRPFHRGLLSVANTIDEIFVQLDQYENTNDHSWLDKVKNN